MMLKLASYPKTFKDSFQLARSAAFQAVVGQPGYNRSAFPGVPWAKRFIDHLEKKLDTLLTGTPQQLAREIKAIETDADFQHFAAYCRLARRPKKDPLYRLYKEVEAMFDYDAMCRDKVSGARAIVQKQGQRICPYCHMHHLNFHVSPDKKKLNLRPPLDHFYPKSVYPYLATSLFNLVPSCEQCNSRIKLAKDPRGPLLTNPLAHPFDKGSPLSFESGWRSVLPLDEIKTSKDFEFGFDGTNQLSKEFAAFFRLDERYAWYEHELLDLVERYKRYLDADPVWHTIDPVQYTLGFPVHEAHKRSVGLMLADAAKRIVATRRK